MTHQQASTVEPSPMVRIGYIVLPTGHGKSFRHRYLPGLAEIDSIVGCNATSELRELRTKAKRRGTPELWGAYDAARLALVSEVLLDKKCLVMVPDDSVGVQAGWKRYGGAYLDRTVWEANMVARGSDSKKWVWSWERVQALPWSDGPFTNDELTGWVERAHAQWVIDLAQPDDPATLVSIGAT